VRIKRGVTTCKEGARRGKSKEKRERRGNKKIVEGTHKTEIGQHDRQKKRRKGGRRDQVHWKKRQRKKVKKQDAGLRPGKKGQTNQHWRKRGGRNKW